MSEKHASGSTSNLTNQSATNRNWSEDIQGALDMQGSDQPQVNSYGNLLFTSIDGWALLVFLKVQRHLDCFVNFYAFSLLGVARGRRLLGIVAAVSS